MVTQFATIGLLILLSAMLPGPDFAIVTQNTIKHSRRAGIFTALGITSACAIHITYCLLGLGLLISKSLWLFNIIKYTGALYLIYLGTLSLITPVNDRSLDIQTTNKKSRLANFAAYSQGFICSLFNPKATLFFLAFFTVIIKPSTPLWLQLLFALEILIIVITWFSCLAIFLSHKHVMHLLRKIEKYISKILGVCLISFGIALVFIHA